MSVQNILFHFQNIQLFNSERGIFLNVGHKISFNKEEVSVGHYMSRKDHKLQKKYNYVIIIHCFCIYIQIIYAIILGRGCCFTIQKILFI